MATLQVSGNNASYTLTLSGMSTSTRYHVFIADLSSSGSVTGYKCIRSSLGSSSTWTYKGSSNSPYSNYRRSVYVYTSTAATSHSVGTTYNYDEMRSGCTIMDTNTIPAASATYTYHSVTIQIETGVFSVRLSYTRDGVSGRSTTIYANEYNGRGTISADEGSNVYVTYVSVEDSTLYGAPYIAKSYNSGSFSDYSHQWEFSSFEISEDNTNDIQVNADRHIGISASKKKTIYYGRLDLHANGGSISSSTNGYSVAWPPGGGFASGEGYGSATVYVTLPDEDTYPSYIPVRDGYRLTGWADSPAASTAKYSSGGRVPITAESTTSLGPTVKTVYAVWEKPYSGSISVNSYTYDSNDKSFQGTLSVTVTLSPASGSWTLKATHSRTSASVSKTMTASGSTTLSTTLVLPYLYMSSEQTYTVTLTAPDGTVVDTIVVPCLDVPTYTLTFNANGGTGAPSALTTYGNVAKVTIPATKPKRLKHKFLGWALGALSTVLEVAVDDLPCEYSLTYSKTLYAVWEAIDTIELFTWTGKDTTDVTMIKKGEPVKAVITAEKWNELLLRVKALVEGCSQSFDYTLVSKGSDITAEQFNDVRLGLTQARVALGKPIGTPIIPDRQEKGYTMYASLFNGGGSIKSALNYLIGVYNDA